MTYQIKRQPAHDYIDVDGINYHVCRWPGHGDQPWVILLHGWMDCAESFQFLVDHLPDNWPILAPDWRGFGQTRHLARSYYFADYLADLDAILRHYSPDQAVMMVGHSMGGNVAGLYAGIRRGGVNRLALLEGFGISDCEASQAPERYASWLDQLRRPPLHRDYPDFPALAARLQQTNPRLKDNQAAFLAEKWGQVSNGRVTLLADPAHRISHPILYRLPEAIACWQQITAPVLWVEGGDSDFTKKLFKNDDLIKRQEVFSNLCQHTIADAGHMLHHDQPATLAGLLVNFRNASFE